jgi:hypothetical protein
MKDESFISDVVMLLWLNGCAQEQKQARTAYVNENYETNDDDTQ